jgi:hypothetical protein
VPGRPGGSAAVGPADDVHGEEVLEARQVADPGGRHERVEESPALVRQDPARLAHGDVLAGAPHELA